MILKRSKKEEESEKLDPKDKEKLETYKKGVAGGVTGVVVGGLAAGIGHISDKVRKAGSGEVKGKVREELQKRMEKLSDADLRKVKAGGLGALGAGATLAAASGIAYGVKKRKIKRAGEKKDDSAKE